MKPLILIILLTFLLAGCNSDPAWASDFSEYSNAQIVEAIGKAENSVKYPYGIKSIDTRGDITYARQICLNSVRNGRRRWIKAGRPEDLVIFISRRYCPISDCPRLNKNWVNSVKWWLTKR